MYNNSVKTTIGVIVITAHC